MIWRGNLYAKSTHIEDSRTNQEAQLLLCQIQEFTHQALLHTTILSCFLDFALVPILLFQVHRRALLISEHKAWIVHDTLDRSDAVPKS